jgi:cytochrome P450
VTTVPSPVTAGRIRPYPFSPPDRLNLDPTYAYLREHEPLARIRLPYGEDAWLVVRYDDARTVLGDARFSRAAALTHDQPRVSPVAANLGLMDLDPPEHTRLRRLVAKAFTQRRVEQLRTRVQQLTDELLDAVIAAGPPADLVEGLALPLPMTVICELLGVPYADRDGVRTWSEALMTATSLTPEQRYDYLGQLAGYMAGLIARRRAAATDDLLGALVLARDEHDRLSEHELLFLAIGLLAAGHETTASQLPNFVYLLLTHPDQLDLLRRRPELLPGAVEELMRYVPFTTAATIPRYALVDVELTGGVVPAGDAVFVARSAANRDPALCADPDRLDVTRTPVPHVGFGHGAHHCIGAQLARLELQVALGSLLSRLPGLRFAVEEPALEWKTGLLMRGLCALPLDWDQP